MSKWCVVVPSNRPEELSAFLYTWNNLFVKHEVEVIVMWDLEAIPMKEKWLDYTPFFGPESYEETPTTRQLCWKDITTKHIPMKTDMVRSFAFKWAYDNTDADYFLTLDDDVRPLKMKDGSELDIFEQYEKGFQGDHLSEYFSVGSLTSTPMEIEMRGYPYKDRAIKEVAVQYGGWHGVLDYDAATQLSSPRGHERFSPIRIPVPKGAACTCCIMNCAWKKKYTPIMWQLPMLDGRYNRVGDIWSGLLIKKTLDTVGAVMLVNGGASVLHQRASNAYNSLVKEAPSVYLNDNLWDSLKAEVPGEVGGYKNLQASYWWFTESAVEFFEKHDKEYADHFRLARDEWMDLFK